MRHMRKTRIAALLLALALCLGLLPMAAMAEEEKEFHITFIASPGQLSDGTGSAIITTTSGDDPSTKHLVQPPADPHQDGYVFGGWYVDHPGEDLSVANRNFDSDTTVQAHWIPNPSTFVLLLNPNGGDLPAGADKTVRLDIETSTAPTLRQELPTPTREGYTFEGWYLDGSTAPVKVGDVFGASETTLTARWAKLRTSKTTPGLTASPAKIEAGAEKIELVLSCATSGVSLDWRPLERALYMGGAPSDWEAAAKSLISGNFSAVGLKLTKVSYQGEKSGYSDGAYPYAFYPEGVYPVGGLVLTLEGKATAGTLTIQLGGECFLEFVPAGSDAVLDAPSADIFSAAQATIPVDGGAAAAVANPDGPFTVKFDLNYKNPKQDEIPKDETVVKGDTVGLPDGTKLTPPAGNYEFYAWCVEGKDGKLYPWKKTNPVTEDMTLYAGWVKKGTAVKKGEALPEATEPSKPTQNPEATVVTDFHDVPANSPFLDSIVWAVKQGITNGKTATTFGPGDPCTRAQIVTFLWRAAGSPEPKTMEGEYADVTNTAAYYYKAIQWAAEMGMEESGTFKPGETCTRGQAMYFIWKARAGVSSAGSAPSFTDLDKGSAYYDAVLWAVGQGVTKGKTETTFGPDDPCTRGQIVTFLYRAYEQ